MSTNSWEREEDAHLEVIELDGAVERHDSDLRTDRQPFSGREDAVLLRLALLRRKEQLLQMGTDLLDEAGLDTRVADVDRKDVVQRLWLARLRAREVRVVLNPVVAIDDEVDRA